MKVGDIIYWCFENKSHPFHYYAVRKGASAKITDMDDEWIYVEWQRDGLDEGQDDGAYLRSQFTTEKDTCEHTSAD